MSLLVVKIKLLIFRDSAFIASRTGIMASVAAATILRAEQSDSLFLLPWFFDSAPAIDPRPFERVWRRESKDVSSSPMLLSEPTSCKSVFKSSILLFVSSWRLKMLIVLVTIDVVSVFDGEETDISCVSDDWGVETDATELDVEDSLTE